MRTLVLYFNRASRWMLADDYGEKGIAFPGMDAHIMKEIIIQHPIIRPLAEEVWFVFWRPSWNTER